jgi:hypothetical protein
MFGGLHSPGALPSAAALLDLGRAFTPRVEAPRPTPVLLDLHGLGRAWPTPEALGRALLDAARERALTVQVALAFSRVAALVLARRRPSLLSRSPFSTSSPGGPTSSAAGGFAPSATSPRFPSPASPSAWGRTGPVSCAWLGERTRRPSSRRRSPPPSR